MPMAKQLHSAAVLHHVIRAFGIAAAEQFLRALATRVGKVLIFEIGTADESSWTPFLPDGSQGQAGQEAFVSELLQRSGFRNVRVIAESAAYHREVQRLLFIAEPAQAARQDLRESLQVA